MLCILTRHVARVCRDEPPASVDRRPDVTAGCPPLPSYNPFDSLKSTREGDIGPELLRGKATGGYVAAPQSLTKGLYEILTELL